MRSGRRFLATCAEGAGPGASAKATDDVFLEPCPHSPHPTLRWRLDGGAEPVGRPRLARAIIVPRGETYAPADARVAAAPGAAFGAPAVLGREEEEAE